MDQSRRAVESYWRSRMVDGATSDEDKVTPVYKLEEICELLRSSHVTVVKEVTEFILKRLQHKSPIVKQKALRVIKYAVGKSGAEFRREMQRNSVSVRQLIHYKGQPDPLKGDALNKAVRETAQEALSAIFSSDDNKPAPTETLGGRIQGFGNTNFEMPSEDKKSFLGEVVGIGSATIKQGLSTLTQSPSLKKNDTGSYRSPNLRRSLTTETEYSDRYEGMSSQSETYSSSRLSQNTGSGNWNQDLRTSQMETADGDSSSSFGRKSREERLLETIVTSGGVRLQPTRDALQVFLVEASKLDALALSRALESKLQSPQWQVRMKAVCVLEAVLRKKNNEHFSSVVSYFSENKDDVVRCSESPQASLREKASKVLNLLDGEQSSEGVVSQEKPVKSESTATQMPDLIDTGDLDNIFGTQESIQRKSNQSIANPATSAALIDDLFADSLGTAVGLIEQKNEDDDAFADVSFHTSNGNEHEADLFSGMTIDKSGITDGHMVATSSEHQLFDVFGSSSEAPQEQSIAKRDVNDLMAGLSVNGNDSFTNQNGTSTGTLSENIFPDASAIPSYQVSNEVLNNLSASQTAGMNANQMFPLGAIPYNIPPGFMFNPAFASQPINYSAMGSLLAQQQFLATMSNFQQLGNLNVSGSADHAAGFKEGYSSPLPDIFNPGMAAQAPTSMMNNSKKEETKAFDFISDHLASARDPKRVV